MAERQYRTLSKRTVDRLAVNGKDAVFWDQALPGFGGACLPERGQGLCRPDPRGRSRTRAGRPPRARSLPTRPARRPARLIARLKAGEPLEAAAPPSTVADLAERYLREYAMCTTSPRPPPTTASCSASISCQRSERSCG